MTDLQQSCRIDTILHDAAQIATEYLQGQSDRELPVVRALEPHELQETLGLSLPRTGRPLEELSEDLRQILDHSVRTGHPRFLNQLFGGFDTAAILGEWIAALTNTSMYTYEVAPVATLMELELIDRLGKLVGFEDGDGIFAPGGSISNLMAVLAARHRAFPGAKREGLGSDERPTMFVSAEAHYSLHRAASIAGFGLNNAVEIATDKHGRMIPSELEREIEAAKANGRTPFFVGATAGTTVPGAFDPFEEIAEVTERHGLWLHVDASYGGSVLFSPRHHHLMKGVERADSVAWNPHKMMGVPLTCSATLMREKGWLRATNGMQADYLFHGDEASRWNLGDMSLQCGRRVDALKLWLSWQAMGDEGYGERVDHLFALAGEFTDRIRARDGFHLVREPQSANVCFRYLPAGARGETGGAAEAREHDATLEIRRQLAERGRFLINYATIDGVATFRLVLSNPTTTIVDLEFLLDEISALGDR